MKEIPKTNSKAEPSKDSIPQRVRKAPYVKPTLHDYGAIADITHAGGSTGSRDLISRVML